MIWRIYLIIAISQSIFALRLFLQFNSGSHSFSLPELSLPSSIMTAAILIVMLLFSWLLADTWLKPSRTERRLEKLFLLVRKPKRMGSIFLVLSLLVLLGCFFITQISGIIEPFTLGIFKRLLPLVLWLTGLSFQTLIALILVNSKGKIMTFSLQAKPFLIILVYFSVVFGLWIWAAQQILPQELQIVGWNSLGIPLLELQVLLAWVAGLLMLYIINLVTNKSAQLGWLKKLVPHKFDIFVGILIWLTTALIWQSMPLIPSWFVSEPTAPNFEYYPTSDARGYDIASQTAIIGNGYSFQKTIIVRRPFHAFYLTILHLIGGQNYKSLIFLQILILAFIPVILYFLTKMLHNRFSGVVAAILIVLREANSIAIAGDFTASHAKLLMVDLLTTLAVVIFTYLATLWIKNIKREKLLALASGGVLGIAMLIRLETFVFIFTVSLVTALILFSNKLYKLWLQNILLFILGVGLVITPWIWRNWQLTGRVFIDSPTFRYSLLSQRYRPISTKKDIPPKSDVEKPLLAPTAAEAIQNGNVLIATPTHQPSVTPKPTKTPQTTRKYIQKSTQKAIAFIRENPIEIGNFILTHYLNSQLQYVQIFPATYRMLESFTGYLGHRNPATFWAECCSLKNYFRSLPYWHKWDGRIPIKTMIPLIITLLILALGINESWKRKKFAGIMPITLSVTYFLFNAVFRNSGGRYTLPVDWTAVLYYSIGLAQLSILIIAYFSKSDILDDFPKIGQEDKSTPRSEKLLHSPNFYAVAIGFFLLGCSIPIMEASFPPLYTKAQKNQMLTALMDSEILSDEQIQQIETFRSKSGKTYIGRGLYPRYLPANEGEPWANRRGSLGPKPFPRMTFYLAGNKTSHMFIPLSEQPTYFPNASDLIVFACPDNEALAVALFNDSEDPQAVIFRSPLPANLSCPLPPILPTTSEN